MKLSIGILSALSLLALCSAPLAGASQDWPCDNYVYPGNFVMGCGNVVTGFGNFVRGNWNYVSGSENRIEGSDSDVSGWDNLVEGNDNWVSGSENRVCGNALAVSNSDQNVGCQLSEDSSDSPATPAP